MSTPDKAKTLPVNEELFDENIYFIYEHTRQYFIKHYPNYPRYIEKIKEGLKEAGGKAVLGSLFTDKDIEEHYEEIMIAASFLMRHCTINSLIEAEAFSPESMIWFQPKGEHGRHMAQKDKRDRQLRLIGFTLRKAEERRAAVEGEL